MSEDIVGKAVVKVGLDDTEIKKGITNLNAQMKVADETWKASLSTFNKSDRSIEKLSVSVRGMTEKLSIQEKIVKAHAERVKKLTEEYGANHTKVLKATADLKKQEGVYGNLKRSISEINNEIKENTIKQKIAEGQQQKLVKSTEELSKQSATLKDKLGLVNQEWKNSVQTAKASGKQINVLDANLKGLTNKLELQKKVVIEHHQNLRKLRAEYGDTDSRVVQANTNLKKQIGTLNELKGSISTVTKEITDFKRAEEFNNNPWTKKTNELQDYSNKLSSIGDKSVGIGQNMTVGITAPVGIGLGFAIKKAKEFETSMSEVQALTGSTGKDFEKLKNYAIELGEKTAFSAKEAADGMAVLGQAGFKTNQIIESMPGLLDLAAASKMSLADSADIVVSSLNSFQLEANKAGHATDVLTKAGAETNAGLNDMGEAMKYVGPVAGSLGYTLEDTAGAIGLLSNYAIKGSQAGTSLRMGLMRLNSPGEKLSKEMAKMGIEVHDSSGKMKSMSGVIAELQDAMKDMSKEEQAAIITRMVGTEASTAWIALMQKSPIEIDKFNKSLENSNGYAKDFAKTMRDNLSGDWDNFTGGLETFAGKVYDDYAPAMRKAVQLGDKLVGAISSAPKPIRMTATALAIGAAATGPVVIGFGMVAKSAGATAEAVSKLTGKMAKNTVVAEGNAVANTVAGLKIGKSTNGVGIAGLNFLKFGKNAETASKSVGLLARGSGLLSGGLRLLGGPIGIAITAITTLVGGFKLAYKHIDWFHKGVDNTGKLMKEVFGTMDWSWVGKLGSGFKKVGSSVLDATGKISRLGFELSPVGIMSKKVFALVGDSVKKATDKVNVFGKDVSKSTEKALGSYVKLSDNAKLQLEKLKITHDVVGKKTLQSVNQTYDKIYTSVSQKITKRSNREISGLRKLFSDTKALSAQEENRILAKAQSGTSKELQAVKIIQKQIKSIYKKAYDEKRSLTRVEENKIANLQMQMGKKVVSNLSKSEKEQRIILGRLKMNKGKLSIEAASQVIKASAKEKNESIKNAKDKRKKIIDEAIYQRDVTKTISKKQADKIIAEADRQYRGSKKNAERQHKKVVDEATSQNKEVKKQINLQTGHVYSKWEQSVKDVKGFTASMSKDIGKKFGHMYSDIKGWLNSTVKKNISAWNDVKRNSTSLAESTRKSVVGKAEEMKKGFTNWTDKIGTYLTSVKTPFTNKATALGKSTAKGAVSGLNLMIDGINAISSKIMGKNLLKHISTKGFHTGTLQSSHNGLVRNGAITRPTLAVVGDKGKGNGPGGFRQEIIHRRNGDLELTPAKDTLVHLNKGDRVYNGQQTHQLLNNHRFHTGTIGDTFNAGMNAVKGFGSAVKDTVVDAGKYVGKIVGDVFEYIENPGKLVDMVLGKVGDIFGGVGGFTGKLGKAAFDTIKKDLVGKVKQWLEEFGGSDADGSEILSFPMTTPYHPNGPTPGYPTAFNGGRHYGIDLGTPYGTTLHAPTSGTVTRQSDYGGGVVARLVSGKIAQYFLHLDRVLKTGPVKQGDAIVKTGNSGHFTTGAHLHYQVENPDSGMLTNRNTIDPVAFLKSKGGGRATPGKGWASEIRRAARQMNVNVTDGDVQNIMAQINRESGGNQNIVQSSAVWDVNTASGNPAQGLLQYIPQTFRAYAMPGHTNIRNGYDQLLAFFNNSNWRRDNPGGRSGWGPSGARRYADGGLINKPHLGLVGEAGPEIIIPLAKKKRSRAEELLNLANKMVFGADTNPTKVSANDKAIASLINEAQKNYKTESNATYLQQITAVSKKIDSVATANAKAIASNEKKIKDYLNKNVDEKYKQEALLAERALNGRTGTIKVKTRLADGNTTKVDKDIADAKEMKAAYTKNISNIKKYIKTLEDKRKKGKTKKERDAYYKEIKDYKKKLKTQEDLLKKSNDALDKHYKYRASLFNRYAVTTKTVKGRSAQTINNLINSSNTKITKNKDAIAQIKNENALYKAQTTNIKNIQKNEAIKNTYLQKIEKERAALVKKLTELQEKETSLREEKTSMKETISSNLQSYAGFGGAKGHTARDFVSWMRYRLNKMRQFAMNVRKVKSMGLDPTLIREMVAGGIESAMPKVEALVRGGSGFISQINSLQAEINREVASISGEQANLAYDPEINSTVGAIKSNQAQQKALEVKADKYLSSTGKVIPLSSAKLSSSKKKTTVKSINAPIKSSSYKIKSGDSLWAIANKYGISVDVLKKANNLKSNLIHPNQTLKIPGIEKPKKVTQLSAKKKKVEAEATKYLLQTAKKLDILGKNDKSIKDLQKRVDKIKHDSDKKNDKLLKDLEKALKNSSKDDKYDTMIDLLSQLVHKESHTYLDGQKISKNVNTNIVQKTKTTARKATKPKPKPKVRKSS